MKADKRWFVTRELRDSADPKLTVKVQLGFPERRNDDFRCAFRVKRLNEGKAVAYAGGVDALQALMNAIEGIATQLRESGRALTWLGGDPGLRRQVPIFLGPEVATEIESFIETKIEAFIQRKKSRAEGKLGKDAKGD
jgi:hypothetical protein